MSTPPVHGPVESKPAPWLVFGWPVAVALAHALLSYGATAADYRSLDRRVGICESGLQAVSAAQAASNASLAGIKGEIGGMRSEMTRELDRLTRAVEKLSDSRVSR